MGKEREGTRSRRGARRGRPGGGAGGAGRLAATAARAGLASCLALSACDPGIEGVGDPLPVVVSAEVVDGPGPIFRTLSVTLDREAGAVVDYRRDGLELRMASPGPRRTHEIALPRLRAGTEYVFEVRPVTGAGDTGAPRVGGFTTGALPPELAALETEVSGTAGFDALVLEIARPSLPWSPVIVDGDGRVVWYSAVPGRGGAGFTLLEDSLFATVSADGVQVFSPRSHRAVSRLSREEGAARTGVEPFTPHHDVIAGPGGTLLFLANDTALVGDTVWTGEAVWRWDPASGALDRIWRSAGHLDPARDRGPRSTPDDWLHANSLGLGPRGNVLVSLFWLHEVLSVAPGGDAVEWRLGGPASSFEGVDAAMEAGQHTAAEVAPDRVLLFDNGLDRGGGRFSRALELALDRERGTARVVWEFRPEPDVWAPIVSSARRLPDGNTVVAFGTAAGFEAPGVGAPATGPLVVYEVDPAGEIVWRMEVTAGAELVYRATPLASVAGERRVR